ncbi:glutaredoxin family protein [Kineococcus sp. R86509]|uniref:glutaredoxin family protein n=1 Tax=Kineococcus sp. R86509 TaxID=3093851 RepID=UPI0036D36B3B
MNVTLYTTGPSCIRCRLSANLLKNSGVAFETVDIRTDPAAQRYVTEELGYVEAPVVVVTDSPAPGLPHLAGLADPDHSSITPDARLWHWSGFRPEQLLALSEGSTAQNVERSTAGAS